MLSSWSIIIIIMTDQLDHGRSVVPSVGRSVGSMMKKMMMKLLLVWWQKNKNWAKGDEVPLQLIDCNPTKQWHKKTKRKKWTDCFFFEAAATPQKKSSSSSPFSCDTTTTATLRLQSIVFFLSQNCEKIVDFQLFGLEFVCVFFWFDCFFSVTFSCIFRGRKKLKLTKVFFCVPIKKI